MAASPLRRVAAVGKRQIRSAEAEWLRFKQRSAAVQIPPASVVHVNGADDASPRSPWPALPPPGYLGQLTPEFQASLRSKREWIERKDCDFYHTLVLRSGEVIQGAWDLRNKELDYLGGISLRGQRLLEMGPASGYLTFFMEDAGADVVGFDAGYDVAVDLIPRPGIDQVAALNDAARYVGVMQNSWWYAHRERDSKAKMAYGNVYDLPGDLGTFDVAVFGSILIHLKDPFTALAQAAARTTKRIVVTEPVQDPGMDPEDSLARFAPLGVDYHTNWWAHTPGVVKRMLEALGFKAISTTFDHYPHRLGHDLTKPPVDMHMFTVVAERF